MKTRTILIVFASIISFSLGCSQLPKTPELIDKTGRIEAQVLSPLRDSLMVRYFGEETAFVISLIDKDEKYLLATILLTSDFETFLFDKETEVCGYSRFEKIDVIIFGDNLCKELFSETGRKKVLAYLEPLEDILEPGLEKFGNLNFIEPEVWVFRLDGNSLKLVDIGMFGFLD